MKMKRIISAALGLSVASTMAVGLSGCGSKTDANTLVWYVVGDKPAAHDEVMAKANEIIEEKIGMKLDMQYIDGASFTEKMKMKMASGDPYDLAFTGYVNSYQTAVEMGGLYDITDLIKETGLDEVIEDFYLETATVNGKIYGIPNIQVVSNPNDIWALKDVVEGIGVEEDLAEIEEKSNIHASYEDLEQLMTVYDRMFEKTHTALPDLYTLSPSGNIATTPVYEGIVAGVAIRKDGTSDEIVSLYETDEFKLGAQKARDWYQKGYIRPDIASAPTESGVEARKQYVFGFSTWKPGQDAYIIRQYGSDEVYAKLNDPYVSRTGALATMTSVGANSKHPKEAVELIKLMNTDSELYNLICWGIEGTHHTINEDGTVSEIADSGYNSIGQNAWKYGNQFNGYVEKGQEPTVWEETNTMNNEADKSPVLGFVPDNTNIQSEIANITNVEAEYKARKEYGTEDLSVWYDEFISKLKQAGVDKVREEIQKQYDEWKASK